MMKPSYSKLGFRLQLFKKNRYIFKSITRQRTAFLRLLVFRKKNTVLIHVYGYSFIQVVKVLKRCYLETTGLDLTLKKQDVSCLTKRNVFLSFLIYRVEKYLETHKYEARLSTQKTSFPIIASCRTLSLPKGNKSKERDTAGHDNEH